MIWMCNGAVINRKKRKEKLLIKNYDIDETRKKKRMNRSGN